jgi:hypothetical protein
MAQALCQQYLEKNKKQQRNNLSLSAKKELTDSLWPMRSTGMRLARLAQASL